MEFVDGDGDEWQEKKKRERERERERELCEYEGVYGVCLFVGVLRWKMN